MDEAIRPAKLIVAGHATMIGTGVVLARKSKRVDPVAARATLPFIAWVSFAAVLTATIWHLNRRDRI